MLNTSMRFHFSASNRSLSVTVCTFQDRTWQTGQSSAQTVILQSSMITYTKKMYDCHVLQADETPMLENKDGRVIESKSYMWVYRTGQMYTDRQIFLYEFQKTRNASHPRKFLKDFSGICVTDGFQVYHTVENGWEDLRIVRCWPYVKRFLNEAVEALPKANQKDSRAYHALTMIQAIYQEEKKLK